VPRHQFSNSRPACMMQRASGKGDLLQTRCDCSEGQNGDHGATGTDTPSEQLMMVSGRAKSENEGRRPRDTPRRADYLNLTSRHVHQFTCMAFLHAFRRAGAAPFDVSLCGRDRQRDSGREALKAAPKPAKTMAKPAKAGITFVERDSFVWSPESD